jgi:hypothetical protein
MLQIGQIIEVDSFKTTSGWLQGFAEGLLIPGELDRLRLGNYVKLLGPDEIM